jgi:ABC-type multidrug transport system fused ATPase/permease subunit
MLSVYRKIRYIYTRKQKIRFVILFFMIIIAGMLETLGVSSVLPLISVVLTPELMETNKLYSFIARTFHLTSVKGFVTLMALVLIAVYILKNVYLALQYRIQTRFLANCRRDVSTRLMKCYVEQDYLYHVEHNVAELNRNVTADVSSFFSLVQACMNFLSEIITVTFILAYLLWTDYVTTLFLVVVLGVFMCVVYRILKKSQIKAGEAIRKSNGNISKWVLQTFGGIKEIKAFNRESYFLNKYDEAYRISNDISIKSSVRNQYPRYILEAVCISSIMLVVCIRVQMGVELMAFATSLSAFIVAAVRLMPSFNRLTNYIGTIMYSKAATDNIYNDLKEQEELDNKRKSEGSRDGELTFNHALKVENLYFKYPQGEENIFEDASVEIPKNKSVAFIGSSGAGKSTFADIILGLLRPDSGKVSVDGYDIFECINSWHHMVGYIPQVIYLMDDTIRKNILFGLDDKDDEKLWESLKLAQLDDFVRSLPEGLDTQIGDRGVRLSGGQRQRIGIARALYNKPELLLLDEATSALDNETESAVMEAVENLHGHTTMIIIAHRLSTISHCDKVYEVADGKIVERDKAEVLAGV